MKYYLFVLLFLGSRYSFAQAPREGRATDRQSYTCDSDTIRIKKQSSISFNLPPLKRAKIYVKIDARYFNQVEIVDPLNGKSFYIVKPYATQLRRDSVLTAFNYTGKDAIFNIVALHIDAELSQRAGWNKNEKCKSGSYAWLKEGFKVIEESDGLKQLVLRYSDIPGRRNEKYENVEVFVKIF